MKTKNKKTITIGIALGIVSLMLIGLGPYITGYTVIDTTDITFKEFPYPFIKNNAYNALFINIPEYATAKEQAAAQVLAQGIQERRFKAPEITTENPRNSNIIYIHENCDDCKEGEAKLSLSSQRGETRIDIMGNVELGAAVLGNFRFFPLKGKEMHIQGNPEKLESIKMQSI